MSLSRGKLFRREFANITEVRNPVSASVNVMLLIAIAPPAVPSSVCATF